MCPDQPVGRYSFLLTYKGLSSPETAMQDHHHIELLLPVEFPLDCTSLCGFHKPTGTSALSLLELQLFTLAPFVLCDYKITYIPDIVNTFFKKSLNILLFINL
jgi:hypothetical protein